MKSRDREYLLRVKSKTIDKCKCRGTDPSCKCVALFNFAVRKINANLPAKYRKFKINDITYSQSKPIVRRLNKYVNNLNEYYNKGVGLLLYGNPGTAKTALGVAILNVVLKEGYSCYFTTLSDCLEILFDYWEDKKNNLFLKLSNVDFLMIDDIGREYRPRSGITEKNLDELIRYRTDSLLPTILTSNLSLEQLGDIYGDRFYSILHEHFIHIPFTTADYRRTVIAKDVEKANKK